MTHEVPSTPDDRDIPRTPEEFTLRYANVLRDLGQDERADTLLRQLSTSRSPSTLSKVGRSWLEAGRLVEAEQVFRAALLPATGTSPDAKTITDLGSVLLLLGKETEAETQWRRSAALGDHLADQNLGAVLMQRGDSEGAEHHYRRAAETGDAGAALALGSLLRDLGRRPEAHQWLRVAVEAGLVEAALLLGADLAQKTPEQDLRAARHWLTLAARSGDTDSEWRLGMVLIQLNETEQARQWLTRAAEKTGAANPAQPEDMRVHRLSDTRTGISMRHRTGEKSLPPSVGAAFHLGALLWREGDHDEARRWLRTASEAGVSDATVRLGHCAGEEGREAEQLYWFGRAHEQGHDRAAFYAGSLCARWELDQEAEEWFARSVAVGNGLAALNLGRMCLHRGEEAQATRWFHRAAEISGYPDADDLVRRLQDDHDLRELAEWLQWCAHRGFSWAIEVFSPNPRRD